MAATGDAGVLDEPGQLLFAGRSRDLSLEHLHAALVFERFQVVHDAFDEVDETDLLAEHGGQCVVVMDEHNFLAHRQQRFLLYDDEAPANLVRH